VVQLVVLRDIIVIRSKKDREIQEVLHPGKKFVLRILAQWKIRKVSNLLIWMVNSH